MLSVKRELKLIAIGVEFSGLLAVGRDRAEIHVEVFDLAGQVAAEMRLNARADGPARLRRVAVEVEARRGDGRVAVGIRRRS